MDHLDHQRRALLVFAGALILSLLLLLWTGVRSVADEAHPQSQQPVESGNSPSVMTAGDTSSNERLAVAGEQLAPASETLCDEAIIPAFWHYVRSVRELPSPEERQIKVIEPATALRQLTDEQRRALGLVSLEGISTETALPNGSSAQQPAIFALMQRWKPCAEARNEDLLGAALQLFSETTATGLERSDPALLSLSCNVLRHFKREADSYAIAPALLSSLRAIAPEPQLNYKQQVQPVVRLLASLGSAHAWLRPSALALVEEPWMTKSGRAAYLMQLTAGGTYEEWAGAINSLIASGSDAAKWGAVEAIRGFATPLKGTEQRMQPEEVVAALPNPLFYHPDTTLRWAVYELVCEYGGEPGRRLMVSLLGDTTCPDRPGVLSFLCHESKLSGSDCASFLNDPEQSLREAAIDGLGQIAKNDPNTLELLRGLARTTPDVEMRRLAVKSLGMSGEIVLSDLKDATHDPEAGVQQEAIRQIGVLQSPQAELLAALASDASLAPAARSEAYGEWLLDAPNGDVNQIFTKMAQDADPDIREQGYLWTGAAAIANGQPDAIREWEQLAIPATLLAKDGTLSKGLADSAVGSTIAATFDGTIRDAITERINKELETLRSPLNQKAIADHDALLAFTGNSEVRSVMLERRFAVSKRILAFLNELPPTK